MNRCTCWVAAAGEQSRDQDISVKCFPVQSNAAQFDLRALGECRVEQPWKPGQWDAERPSVGQFDPHCVVVEANVACRNGRVVESSRDGSRCNREFRRGEIVPGCRPLTRIMVAALIRDNTWELTRSRCTHLLI